MSANFTPTLHEYTNLTPFRFWCQKILPLAYDDSLSYYELLCKVVDYLNKTMEDVTLSIEDVENLHTAYVALQGYVNNYFNNLDVQEEINNKLDALVADGTIHTIFTPDVMAILNVAQQASLDAIATIPTQVSTWLGQHVSPETGYVIDDTLTISGAAADAKAAGDAIGELKSDLESFSYVVTKNTVPWTQGYIRNDGTNGDDSAACRTNGFIRLQGSVTVTPKDSYKCMIYEYSSDSLSSFVRMVTNTFITAATEITVDPYHYYRFVVRKIDGSNITYNTLPADTVTYTERQYTDPTFEMEGIPADSKATGDRITLLEYDTLEKVNDILEEFKYVNIFNPATITSDKYLDINNGNPVSGAGNFCSDYIDVAQYDSIILIGTHIVCMYDASRSYIGHPADMDSRYNNVTFEVPANCKFIRFSTQDSYLNTVQIGENVNRSIYSPYGYFEMPYLLENQNAITVKPAGGDYSSFTQAIKDNLSRNVKIVVYPGVYDIAAEYEAIWGETAVANMSDDSTVFGGFQYGIILRNKNIEFMPGAKLVCDWTGHTVNGSHRFSPLRVDYNVTLKGLYLECVHTFYAVHDDYGLTTTPYTVTYKDCVILGENLVQQNVIGGGCKKYSRHILDNCYFNNGQNSNIHTVRYHNTNQADAVPEIFVSNCFFNGTLTARWYGTQTSKMRVYVNNCKARAIYAMQEAAGYTEENVDLFKWNNEETNPVT